MPMNQETVLSENAFLMSQTDSKGNIIYANTEFCKVAEYEIDELLGKPHNMVRHKDMPKAAFADLWATIKKGEVWDGFVKNETSSGGYYWVFATIYPYKNDEGEQCYLSCRRKPTPSQIQKAINLYKTLS